MTGCRIEKGNDVSRKKGGTSFLFYECCCNGIIRAIISSMDKGLCVSPSTGRNGWPLIDECRGIWP